MADLNMNVTILQGNVGKEPRIVEKDGRTMVFFSLAVNRDYEREGETVKNTVWWNIKVFGFHAQAVANDLRKGMTVLVIGGNDRQPEVYVPEDKDNPPSANLELVANVVAVVLK